jgi:hypothetical protein
MLVGCYPFQSPQDDAALAAGIASMLKRIRCGAGAGKGGGRGREKSRAQPLGDAQTDTVRGGGWNGDGRGREKSRAQPLGDAQTDTVRGGGWKGGRQGAGEVKGPAAGGCSNGYGAGRGLERGTAGDGRSQGPSLLGPGQAAFLLEPLSSTSAARPCPPFNPPPQGARLRAARGPRPERAVRGAAAAAAGARREPADRHGRDHAGGGGLRSCRWGGGVKGGGRALLSLAASCARPGAQPPRCEAGPPARGPARCLMPPRSCPPPPQDPWFMTDLPPVRGSRAGGGREGWS